MVESYDCVVIVYDSFNCLKNKFILCFLEVLSYWQNWAKELTEFPGNRYQDTSKFKSIIPDILTGNFEGDWVNVGLVKMSSTSHMLGSTN